MSFQRLTTLSDEELSNEIASLKRTTSAGPMNIRMIAQQRLDDAKAERDRRTSNPSGLTGLICMIITFSAITISQLAELPHV